MPRMIAIAFLFLTPLLLACSEDQDTGILGVPTPPMQTRITIDGPSLIVAPGAYQWRARLHERFDDVRYEWTVGGGELPGATVTSEGELLSIALDESFRGALDISLTVYAADGSVLGWQVLSVCPASPAMDWCTPYLLVEEGQG